MVNHPGGETGELDGVGVCALLPGIEVSAKRTAAYTNKAFAMVRLCIKDSESRFSVVYT